MVPNPIGDSREQLTPVWISGPVRSGKTTALVDHLVHWSQVQLGPPSSSAAVDPGTQGGGSPRWLVFAANADNRQRLMQHVFRATQGKTAIRTTTPLAFLEDEVLLFWPLILPALQVQAQFPLRLRPETEQHLATQLWGTGPLEQLQQLEPLSRDRWVRRLLDLLQLAAFSGLTLEQLPHRLNQDFASSQWDTATGEMIGVLLRQWRDWCLHRGLLTYGLITELFWRYLLPDPIYQAQLQHRFCGVCADDVDNYGAIARDLFELLLEGGAAGVFTYNPDGAIRLGLGADPEYMLGLRDRCQVQQLSPLPATSLGAMWGHAVEEWVQQPPLHLPNPVVSLQTRSRGQLLRLTAETIVQAIQAGEVQPQEIAIIGPGLDTIARYTLMEILGKQGIPVASLKDQRPLTSAALIRALLTLLTLVYPGLGHCVDREQIAEMLVVLTAAVPSTSAGASLAPAIDPVRAGLLADYCFQPHPDRPQLLPVTVFPRWDRLGAAATTAYNGVLNWLQQQRGADHRADSSPPYLTLSPVFVLDRAIQQFCTEPSLTPDQLSVLRKLMETAQHFWQVEPRLRQTQSEPRPLPEAVGQFVRLLRQGSITANPYPANTWGPERQALVLATTFQYRMARPAHRWQFWLDAGSARWQGSGTVTLWGAPLFLRGWSGEPLTVADQVHQDQLLLQRVLLDLLGRAQERVYLCHSDLSVRGQDQAGPLLPWVDATLGPL